LIDEDVHTLMCCSSRFGVALPSDVCNVVMYAEV